MAYKGYRRDGFTPEKRKACVAALAEYGTVADACRVAGLSTTTFYRHEKKDPAFASQCQAARAKASASLDVLAWERGVTGIEEPLVAGGKVVGTRLKRSDSIFKLILQASDPDKYGAPVGGGRGGESPDAMEQRLRKEIGDDLIRQEEEARAAIWLKLHQMHRRMCGRPDCAECNDPNPPAMSPRQLKPWEEGYPGQAEGPSG